MRLRGIEFGRVLGASGVQGFFGEGYRTHRLLGPFGPKFKGVTFVAKTCTLLPRAGNMPLRPDFTPRDLFPDCIVVRPLKGVVLNAVGLSNPGIEALLEAGLWQQRTEPFMLSFMSVAPTRDERLQELVRFVRILLEHQREFRAPFGLQLNYSCGNTGHDLGELMHEVQDGLRAAAALRVPLLPKLAVTMPTRAISDIAKMGECDAIVFTNAIKWGELPDKIPWERLFGSKTSPLARYGGGALIGRALLPLLESGLEQLKWANVTKPTNALGGITCAADVARVAPYCFSIGVGTVAIVRPTNIPEIVEAADIHCLP